MTEKDFGQIQKLIVLLGNELKDGLRETANALIEKQVRFSADHNQFLLPSGELDPTGRRWEYNKWEL